MDVTAGAPVPIAGPGTRSTAFQVFAAGRQSHLYECTWFLEPVSVEVLGISMALACSCKREIVSEEGEDPVAGPLHL
jgi:hypothetical protein